MSPTAPVPASPVVNTLARFAWPWRPDRGDGTYRNPIIHADYSDPDVIRHGEDFYLTASSFNCTPGLPILHSRDLVNWTVIGHALKNLPHPRYAEVQPGCGVWAPAIRFHAGKFWIFFPMPDEGIYVTTANDPRCAWSEPRLLQAGKGLIDPCPLWDEDGQAYLVHAYAGSRAGIKHRLRVCPMAPDASRLLGEGQIVFHDPERHPTLEGPKFHKRDGWYYILAPAGGVATGWQVVLRSRNVFGPYEDKIVLAQGDTDVNGPHQGALVDTPNGDWWFIHFQDVGVYGRITHLQPVRWHDAWPLMGTGARSGETGEPVVSAPKPEVIGASVEPVIPQTTDEFNSECLGLQWQWQANHRPDWFSLTARPGWLRLFPQAAAASFNLQPNLLLQKFPARSFTVETSLEFSARQPGEEAGLVVAGETPLMLGLQFDGAKQWVVLRAGDDATPTVLAETECKSIRLRVAVQDGGMCSFAYEAGGFFVPVQQVFQAKPGVWMGAKVGLYSIKQTLNTSVGHVDIEHFRFA